MITLAYHGMGTRFELALDGKPDTYLQSAGEEAIREIARIESRLSLYRENSDLCEINRLAATRPVQLDDEMFAFLSTAKEICRTTEGCFDMTVAPLSRVWGFVGGSGVMPNANAVATAREVLGMHHLEFDESERTVRFLKPGVELDPGAIGKGYALDRAAEILRELDVPIALIHGGTSSVVAMGAPDGEEGWRVAIARPPTLPGEGDLAVHSLRDTTLSVSAPHTKSFTINGEVYGHVLDPRTGEPAKTCHLATVICPSAMLGDALSTALLVGGIELFRKLQDKMPGALMEVFWFGKQESRSTAT